MHTLRMLVGGTALAATIAIVAACGSDSSSSSTSPSARARPARARTTFVIMNNTVCPTSITVSRGTQVTFSNQDIVIHEIDSDPHPEHTDCPELNQVDFLNPGQSRQSGNLNIARTCGFHDHQNPDRASMKGTIRIQ